MKKILSFILLASFVFPSLQVSAAESTAGYIDAIDTSVVLRYNSLVGWAFDPSFPEASVYVEVWIDDELAGASSVSLSRPDVADVFPTTENQGFSFSIPHRYFDGEWHEARAYVVNQDSADRWELNGSPFVFKDLDPGVDGYVDTAEIYNPQDPEVFVRGWAIDQGDTSHEVVVLAYDGDAREGRLLGTGIANISRTDLSSLGQGTYHGYAFPIDVDDYSADDVIHINVYAIDTTLGELKYVGDTTYLVGD